MIDGELRDTLETARRRRRKSEVQVATIVNRQDPTWLRLRANCCNESSRHVDLDEHCDAIFVTVEAFRKATGGGTNADARPPAAAPGKA